MGWKTFLPTWLFVMILWRTIWAINLIPTISIPLYCHNFHSGSILWNISKRPSKNEKASIYPIRPFGNGWKVKVSNGTARKVGSTKPGNMIRGSWEKKEHRKGLLEPYCLFQGVFSSAPSSLARKIQRPTTNMTMINKIVAPRMKYLPPVRCA
jgi:hypothetical protein